jgi:hypothetical protein
MHIYVNMHDILVNMNCKKYMGYEISIITEEAIKWYFKKKQCLFFEKIKNFNIKENFFNFIDLPYIIIKL